MYIPIPTDNPDYVLVIEGGASASYLGATCELADDLVYECGRSSEEGCIDIRHFHMLTVDGDMASDAYANRVFTELDDRQNDRALE